MEVICYACGRGEFPENTMEAIANCQEVNSQWRIEMDLQLTKDNEVVLLHDEQTGRTTGQDGLVAELSLDELQKLNAGYSFEKDDTFPFRNLKLSVPTLKQVFQTYPGINVLLDVHSANLAIVPLIIDLIEDHNMKDQVVIVSKYDEIVSAFKIVKPKWTYGAATREVKKLIYSSFLKLDRFFPLKSDILMIPLKYGKMTVLTSQIIRHAQKRNKSIWAWMEEGESVVTVNSVSEMKQLERQGVKGCFTEFPSKIAKELQI